MITETVFEKHHDYYPIKFGEIDIPLKADDIIISGYDEGFQGSDEAWDAHYYLKVDRDRLETDEEFQKRQESEELQKKWNKQRRYESYLKLKKEFENE